MFTIDTQEVRLAFSQLKKSVQWKHRRYNYGERYFRMVDAQRRQVHVKMLAL